VLSNLSCTDAIRTERSKERSYSQSTAALKYPSSHSGRYSYKTSVSRSYQHSCKPSVWKHRPCNCHESEALRHLPSVSVVLAPYRRSFLSSHGCVSACEQPHQFFHSRQTGNSFRITWLWIISIDGSVVKVWRLKICSEEIHGTLSTACKPLI
jgi:hypothetical protein